MSKVEVEEIVKYILDHPSTLLWYRWYLRQKHHLPFFSLVYSEDLRQKGVPVDVNKDGEVVVLVPIYTPYGIGGSEVMLTSPDKVMWADEDFAFFGNWKFYGRFAWMVSLNRKHPLRRYAVGEMRKEMRMHADKS